MKYIFIGWLILTFAGPLWMLFSGKVDLKADYRTANRDSAHIAPSPKTEKQAVIQVYAARAFNWRGMFASHSWIATKEKDATEYTVYQVIGWRIYHGLPALSIESDIPDRNWYNGVPKLLLDIRGKKAEELIPKIDHAAKTYPDAAPYKVWPGPNSNTFPAYVARQIPELELALPADALGKDLLPKGTYFAKAPSGTGYQVSLNGVAGLLIARKEGFEINLLGLVYGVKFSPLRLLLPGVV
jgi:hypothetical protein